MMLRAESNAGWAVAEPSPPSFGNSDLGRGEAGSRMTPMSQVAARWTRGMGCWTMLRRGDATTTTARQQYGVLYGGSTE